MKYAVRVIKDELKLNDERICEALENALTRGDVLIRFVNGKYNVSISYGSSEHDDATYEIFDEAEYGRSEKLVEAMRFALGHHFGSYDDPKVWS